MKKFFLLSLAPVLLLTGSRVLSQNKLSIENVYSAYLRNSGTIMKDNQINGYFFLYRSDKIDKNTNEYTLQILDQNLNKVRDIKFEDSKNINLVEASYNGNSLAFLFRDFEALTLEMKIFDLEGKLKYTYSKNYDKNSYAVMSQTTKAHAEEGANQSIFDLGEKGYAVVYPLKEGKQYTYEVSVVSSDQKKEWLYHPSDEERFSVIEFLGNTDSLMIFQVVKRTKMLGGKTGAQILGINFVTKKKAFELNDENDDYRFSPSGISQLKDGNILILGTYFGKKENIEKDFGKGLAAYVISSRGKILEKNYNAWVEDIGRYLPLNKRGKVDKIGFLYIHKLIQTPDGRIFVVGEGYKRQANAAGIASTMLLGRGGVTKLVVTDLVILEFNNKYKISGVTIYDKANNTVESSGLTDMNSQHSVARLIKSIGGFDYAFTTGEPDNSIFTICYGDWVKSDGYKGSTFNSIRYSNNKFSTDKIELKTKASTIRVFPAKAGSIMILEYFKKEKRLDFRLEKLG